MQKSNVAVATITWARDVEEETLLRESLQELAALHIPVFISDGGSPTGFISFLTNFPHFTVVHPLSRGLWGQAKSSLQAACNSGASFILYTEPDKKLFFQKHLSRFLTDATTSEQTGIVLAARTPAAFASFPAFQQKTETTINDCCAAIIGQNFDYTYGPFLLNRNLVFQLNELREDIGWGWRPYIFGLAYRMGYHLVSVTGEYHCPLAQQTDDAAEQLYRMRQLAQNINGLVLSTSIPPL